MDFNAEASDGLVANAKKLYYEYTDNHPHIHSNRFPIWEELSPDSQEPWLQKASGHV